MAERRSRHITGFNDLVVDAIQETIEGVLGKSVTKPFWYHLQAYLGITQHEIPYRLETLFASLNQTFGIGGETLGRAIVRKLYAKAGVEPVPEFNGNLVKSVENLKQILASTDYDNA